MGPTLSEPLGPEQRVDEIDHEPDRHEAGERIIEDHGKDSSEPIAGDGVADGQREEADGSGHQNDVQHVDAPSDEQFSGRSGWLVARYCAPLTRDTCHRSHMNSRGPRDQRYKNFIKINGGSRYNPIANPSSAQGSFTKCRLRQSAVLDGSLPARTVPEKA